jgi:hypothetical protein
MICDNLQGGCKGLKKLFTYQKATTYLAMSKKGTNKRLVAKLRVAAESFKQSKDFDLLVTDWLEKFESKTTLNMYEQDGIIVLGKLE